MRSVYLITAFAVVLVFSIFGMRGTKFTSPPIDVFPEWAFPGMNRQPKFRPQSASEFFADGRADRMPPEHVVRADLPVRNDDHLYFGKDATGAFARGFPALLTVNMKFIGRGRDRYTIYCQPCHGAVGDGQGITKPYGMGATPTYNDDRLRNMAGGEPFTMLPIFSA